MNNILKYFADYIESQIGIVYSDASYFLLEHRLNEIVTRLKLKSINELYELAQKGIYSELRLELLDIATNNETSFFRDPNVFDVLIKTIIPELISKGIMDCRIWSAASSTGQEAYSIAMAIEHAKDMGLISNRFEYKITASDISNRVLKIAESGTYTQLEVQRGLPARLMLKYFEKQGDDQWQITEKLRNKISFKTINLSEPFPTVGTFDIIFCRNVLIYQSVANKSKVIERLSQVLGHKAYLFLGAAESMMGISENYKQLLSDNAVYYQKND